MKVEVELSAEDIERIADAVAARVGKSNAASGPMLLTHRDVGVSPRTWRAAIKQGELIAVRVGRELRAYRADVEVWLAKCQPRRKPHASEIAATTGDELDALLAAGSLRAIRGGRS